MRHLKQLLETNESRACTIMVGIIVIMPPACVTALETQFNSRDRYIDIKEAVYLVWRRLTSPILLADLGSLNLQCNDYMYKGEGDFASYYVTYLWCSCLFIRSLDRIHTMFYRHVIFKLVDETSLWIRNNRTASHASRNTNM